METHINEDAGPSGPSQKQKKAWLTVRISSSKSSRVAASLHESSTDGGFDRERDWIHNAVAMMWCPIVPKYPSSPGWRTHIDEVYKVMHAN